MKTRFQYQLRTPFIILTTVATTVGFNLGILRFRGGARFLDQGWYDAGLSLSVWGQVPYAVVCVLGIKWVLEYNQPRTFADRLMLSALIVSLAWNLLISGILFFTVEKFASDIPFRFFLHNLTTIVSALLNAIFWLLMILAYLRQRKSTNA